MSVQRCYLKGRDDTVTFEFNHLYFQLLLLDFSLTVKAAPHECVIRTSQPKSLINAEKEAWFYSKSLYHLVPSTQSLFSP